MLRRTDLSASRQRVLGAGLVLIAVAVPTYAIAQDRAPSSERVLSSCPTADQATKDYLRTGQSFKPTGTCPEDAVASPGGPESFAPPAPDARPMSLSEAQRTYDPENRRDVVVDKAKDGTVGVVSINGNVPLEVDTFEELRQWSGVDLP